MLAKVPLYTSLAELRMLFQTLSFKALREHKEREEGTVKERKRTAGKT